jgi:hypothetical protein
MAQMKPEIKARPAETGSTTDLILEVPTELVDLYLSEIEEACQRVADKLAER